MDVLTGAFQILAVVIVVGGIAKLASPDGFSTLLRTLGLPSGRLLSRLSGAVEVAIGLAAIIVGGRLAALVIAAMYAVFAVVVMAARRAGAESCGCFGAVASPPSIVHVIVNAVSALIALAAAIGGPIPIGDVLADQPLAGIPYLITIATGAWLTVVMDTTGAQLVDRIAAVSAMGPTFRENNPSASRLGHQHQHTNSTDVSNRSRQGGN